MLARLERLLLDIAAAAVALLCVLITGSVVLRAVLNSGVPDTVVIVADLMVAAIVLPLAGATAQRAHIVIEIVAQRMPRRMQDVLIFLGSVIGLLALLPMLYASWNELTKTYASGAFYFGELNWPKWPGRAAFFAGLAFCWLRLALLAFGDLRCLLAGQPIDTGGAQTDPASQDAP